MPPDLTTQLQSIRADCDKNQAESPLSAARVQVMAVSKTQTAETIETAIDAGITLFGENRVQEAAQKWPLLRARHPQVKLHLIGPLQTNKVKDALALFDAIETVDRERLVDAIEKVMMDGQMIDGENSSSMIRPSAHLSSHFYIQINTGEEAQKAGCSPRDAGKLLEYARAAKLNVVGLMCIPPARDYPAPHFALMHTLAKELGLKELSMGMSHDYALAVRFGATHVRVGTALFGERAI